jgi:segregation and condensation protein B
MNTDTKIESILFFKGEPVSREFLAKTLECSAHDIDDGLKKLEATLADRGVTLIFDEDMVSMGTSPEASALIEKITKEELIKDIGKSGLETLSIIIYKNIVPKRDIDYIRGVNSAFILRNLMIRGLVERVEVKGERGYCYKPTTELLAFLGVSRIEDLPEYSTVTKELEDFTKKEDNTDTQIETNGSH